MSRSEEIAEFVEDSGGIASAAQIAKAGFLPGSISYALESGAIDKLTQGVYCLPEVFDDEFAAIPYRWCKCVLSHGSALYLAGLSDRVPAAIDVTVPRGYNPRRLTQEYPDTKIRRLPPELYELGIVKAKSPGGGTVKAYCAERAIADLILQRVSEGADPSSSATRSRVISKERRRPAQARTDAQRARRRERVQDVFGGAHVMRSDASLKSKICAII